MSEWREITLKEICTEISYGYTASATDIDFGVRFLRITDIVNRPINWDKVPYCSISPRDIEKYRLSKGDIVIARTGATTGYNYTFNSDIPCVFASYLIRYKINQNQADPAFIGFNLQSENWKGFVENIIGGSAQPGANAQQFGTYEMILPPLPEQQAIAEVLSSIDDKIDLLHRNNKTLEEMAETLFRQWFVEGAKEEWEEVTIGSLCTRITKGTTPTTLGKNFKDSGVSFIKAESIEDHGGFVKSKFAYIDNDTHDLLLRSQLEVGDVLYTIAGTIGRTAIVTEDILPANTNQAVAILKADTKKISNLFLKYLMKSDIITDVLESKVVHAVQPNLSLGEISSTQLKMPTTEIMKKFNETAENISMKINSNIYELTNLVGLRDLLLPKLMSGQVRVNV